MANHTLSSDIRRYALAGAQARLAEISLELEAIRRAFPELRQNGSGGARPRQSAVTGGDAPTTRSRRRSTMSAAQRKAVGERMKKYWAARRGDSQAASASDGPETGAARASRATKTVGTTKRGHRTMSPEARKRISDAQKARWAAQRSGAKAASASQSSEAPSAATRKGRRSPAKARTRASNRGPRKMSAAARKRISQAQKKRWAAKRAAQ
jgi:adenine-specific DNA methylase